MFAYISGILKHKEPTHAVVEVGGIGYEIKISLITYSLLELDKPCTLFTHLQVREDAHTLIGFTTEGDKKLFLQLTSVSGIGANTALAIMSSMTGEEIRTSIASENVKLLQSIKGIGLKTAQRVVLELKDKIRKDGVVGDLSISGMGASPAVHQEEAVLALVTLGYNRALAEKSVLNVVKKHGSGLNVEEIIKLALKDN